jgi:6-phosphogluconolactonase (cycloisomerase 2 family)
MRNPTPRRSFLSQISKVFAAVAASKWLLPRAFAQMSTDSSTPVFVYVGCYTTEAREGFGQGINVYRIDPVSGDWAHVQLVADLVNPSFLALDHDRRFLYSAHGDERYATAFAIDAVNGTLKFLNRQDTGGTNGVHVAVDSSNRHLVVSNYASGSVAVLPINANGSLAPRSDLVELPGAHGPHPVQQTSSHPHQNPFGLQGRFLLVPDKGLDEVFVLSLDAATGKLVWADTPSIATEPGAGPRHLDFHPTLPYVYVLNELDSTVAVYDYDSQNGGLSRRQLLSTLPNDFIGTNTTAEIWVHPSGRFLYCSNRGHDSIAAYAIDQANGSLTILGWTPSGGVRPRYFGLAPSGTHLYACNERSHNIVALRIDPATGMLTATGQRIETGSPVTMVFSAQRR